MSKEKREDKRGDTSTERMSGSADGGTPPARRGVTVVFHYRDGVEVIQLAPGEAQVVGRGEPSDLRLPDRTLSREHARFSLLEGRVLVEDLGSTNGTWAGGTRVERAEIALGGEVLLGTVVAHVVVLGAATLPQVESEESFRARIQDEIKRARHFGRRFAILAVRALTLEAARSPVSAWVTGLLTRLRTDIDRASLYSPDTALVLLPETGAEAASQMAHAVSSAPGPDGVPHAVGIAVYPEAATTVEKLIELARGAAGRASAARPVMTASTDVWAKSDVTLGHEGMIVGAAMRELIDAARKVASSRVPVILHGETGTGKELMARFIHEHSAQRDKPPVSVNCAALPPSLLESSLFGHERGAFTGASHQRIGVFEAAHQGTLFLDEVGELSLAAQAALLRVLETGRFSRVGSTHEVEVRVRVIAATHRDLAAMVRQGAFREDLYYRLSTIELEVPPLRERRDEMAPLVKLFLKEANAAHGRSVRGISDKAMAMLHVYRWPGNVRELRNVVERAVVLVRSELIQPEDLPPRVRAAAAHAAAQEAPPRTPEEEHLAGDTASERSVKAHVRKAEAQMIKEVLDRVGGSRVAAARQLGMPLRTLGRRIKELGLKSAK
ncbi:sigma 54-interacting transcriptional regulator [Sorangium sp. So ce131]|uniref:sigma 54-interacting transcriptional regulator n=1 Tax=Sorangium sp. So ce131 TaxID=3133282 RepID=UPI003F6331CD